MANNFRYNFLLKTMPCISTVSHSPEGYPENMPGSNYHNHSA